MASAPAAARSRKSGPKGIPAPKPKAATKDAVQTTDDAKAKAAESSADAGAHAVKLRELVGRVVDATGGKKKGVKEMR